MSMQAVRLWLPVVICVAGVVLIFVDPDRIEAGILLVSAGLSAWLLNWLYRVGVAGDRDRDAEEEARDYYAKHGRWPDEG
jgi:hypothetical protein